MNRTFLIAAAFIATTFPAQARDGAMFGIPFDVPPSAPSYYQEQLRVQQQRLDEHIRTERNRRYNEGLGGEGAYDNY